MKLTGPQHLLLVSAKRWTDESETEGVAAKGSGVRVAERLEALGLLVYVDHGPCFDESHDREYPIYAITDAGRAVLSALDDPAAPATKEDGDGQ